MSQRNPLVRLLLCHHARKESVMDQRRSGRFLVGVARFVIGSTLLMVGSMVALTGAVTVVGLPIGLIVLAVGLDLMLGPGRRRRSERNAATAPSER
jgi:choline-glycine betaine transporter